ncbi:MAG: ABC transporter ATP-binding protein [Trueperaceae bacterium]|nr:MAG: ABC transporter ATP-binding protein [Trueperaceae bacterium]
MTSSPIRAAPVRLEDVTKLFSKEVVAVDQVDLTVEPGTLVTLLGPSGCGKTTTLRMIAGLERATSGRIFIDDEEVTRLPANLRDVTMVFQSYALFPHMNVFENVAYGLQVARQPKEAIRSQTLEALAMVGLEGLENRATNALSGGQQQRVALARALVMQPKVLLFDEPLSNLDAKLRKRVREDIRDLQKRLGITSVYVTHDQEEALAISDEIVVMNLGRIVQRGTPHELYSRPATRFVADFIGSASFLAGHYDGKAVTIGGFSFPHQQETPAGEVTVMIRPEAIRLSTDRAGLETTVRSSSYLGAVTDFVFSSPHGDIAATIPGEGLTPLLRDDTAYLTFRSAGIHLLPANDRHKNPDS